MKNSYKEAGVDVEAGDELVERIKPLARRTHIGHKVIGGIGGFGGMIEIPPGYKQPVLVSGTDGVGTKIKLALQHNDLSGIGQDLVAMCVNDILVSGAEPLYFMDYYATSKLDNDQALIVIQGIAEACFLSGMALLGGETAEMPGMYQGDDFDLAGFAVGVIERSRAERENKMDEKTVLIGLESNGVHSNGFSLIRGILDKHDDRVDVAQSCLRPTKIYVDEMMVVRNLIQGAAHITGGGISSNIDRMIPKGYTHRFNWGMLPLNESDTVFNRLQTLGELTFAEMVTTFNCGVGMVLAVHEKNVERVMLSLKAVGTLGHIVGNVVKE